MFTGPALLSPGEMSSESVTVAVLLIVPQLAVVVTAVIVTVFFAFDDIVPKLHVSVEPPVSSVGEHSPALAPSTVQVSPDGSTSVITTSVESLSPPAVTVTL